MRCLSCNQLYEHLECNPLNYCPNCGSKIINILPLNEGEGIKVIESERAKFARLVYIKYDKNSNKEKSNEL